MTHRSAPSTVERRRAAPLRSWLHERVREKLLESLSRIETGQIVVEEGPARRVFGGPSEACPLSARIRVRDPAFYPSLGLGGSLGATESFVRAEWSCDDLVALVRILLRNRDALDRLDTGLARAAEPLRRAFHRLHRNTRKGSRRNIAAHYDLGNELFASFLDPSMTYSAAFFEKEGADLEEAQAAKYDRLCRKLGLGRDDHVLEIGTGWGGFAIHAAGRYGCRVTTTTLSREQHALAQERLARAGLSGRVRVLLEDYRELRGRFDKLVSIEMIEAVGHEHLGTYFRACADRLRPEGAMALQAITINDQEYERAQHSVDFVKRYIFPGGHLPSVSAMSAAATDSSDLRIVHLEEMTPHYAETLRRWRERFLQNRARVRELGYDEAFQRMWEFYLAYCEGAFHERHVGSVQLLLAKPGWRDALPGGSRPSLAQRASA